MLFIHNDMVVKLLSMRDCIEAQEQAFRQIPSGRAIHRPRLDMYVPCDLPDGYYRWGTMEGANDGILAIRMKSDIITWPKNADGVWRENKYCVKPGAFCGLILLLSTKNGEPLAFINDGVLQHMRVGGGAGIGARTWRAGMPALSESSVPAEWREPFSRRSASSGRSSGRKCSARRPPTGIATRTR